MTALHEDPRVRAGMRAQFAQRQRLLDAGARRLGWKLGLGTPAAMKQAGTSAPLVGFLTDRGLLASGAEVAVGPWTKPGAEPEVAVHVARDVPAGASEDEAAAAIGGLGTAIEVVDLDVPMDDVEAILASDIFHRHVILGPARPHAGAVSGTIRVRDETLTADDAFAAPGDPVSAVRHVAAHVAAFGEALRAGDVIITGSIVPLIAVAPGDRVDYRNEPLGGLSVGFRD
jgi:2-keto-4-pentenoate hydratase